MIDTDDVRAAAQRIRSRVRRTPVMRADRQLWFKLELTQHAGSFKTRGMFNQILAAAERGALPAAGVVAASGGNAGLAAAYALSEHGADVVKAVFAPAKKAAEDDEKATGKDMAGIHVSHSARVSATGHTRMRRVQKAKAGLDPGLASGTVLAASDFGQRHLRHRPTLGLRPWWRAALCLRLWRR